ncbi:MAG: CoF synthetase [Bdellovibrionaceae bacterium]|nr:CoF synthetase [Pseudobdellovibrionaceae bacterium]|tara:strand:+ start:69925 stop:71196 length:1272 start_codon:yes stop_codon:yes gene_type:complete
MLRSRIILPLVERIENREILRKVDFLAEHHSLSFEERKVRQKQSIFENLEWAKNEVPYYKDLFSSISFDPDKIKQDLKFIEEIPPLTKDIILEQGSRMKATSLLKEKRIGCKTGGSTGKKVVIDYNQEAADWASAVTLYARSLIGKQLGDKELHFASDFGDVPPLKAKMREAAKNFSLNRKNVFYKDFENENIQDMIRIIREDRPTLVHCHPSTMYAIAEAMGGPVKDPLFQVFESSGELLDARKRAKIQETFDCKVIDRYGLAEFGVVAYESNEDSRLNVFDSIVYPEIVDGEITLTGLFNKLMPLIRYKTGDMAELIEGPEGYYFQNMLGRIHDRLEIDGKVYLTHYIQDVLDHRVRGVKEFQIKKNSDHYELRLVTEFGANKEAISEKIKNYFPSQLAIKFINHDDLELVGWRGKFRYVI